MADNRPVAYREGDTSIYRASGLGSCIRTLVAAMLEYKEWRAGYQSEILDLAAEEGNLHEDQIVERLEKDGYEVLETQGLVEKQVIPGVLIRGHTDGLVLPPRARKNRVLEAKTMSQDRFKKWSTPDTIEHRFLLDDFQRYAWQISSYMHDEDLEAVYAVKNRNTGKLLIEEIKHPPVSWRRIRKKVIEAEKWRLREELPPCDATGGEKFFCPFPYLHDDKYGDEEDDGPVVDDVMIVVIEALAEEHYTMSKDVKKLKIIEEERKTVGKRLVEAMGGEHGPKHVSAGPYRVTRVDTSRGYVDDIAVAEELGIAPDEYKDIVKKFTKKRDIHYPKVEWEDK